MSAVKKGDPTCLTLADETYCCDGECTYSPSDDEPCDCECCTSSTGVSDPVEDGHTDPVKRNDGDKSKNRSDSSANPKTPPHRAGNNSEENPFRPPDVPKNRVSSIRAIYENMSNSRIRDKNSLDRDTQPGTSKQSSKPSQNVKDAASGLIDLSIGKKISIATGGDSTSNPVDLTGGSVGGSERSVSEERIVESASMDMSSEDRTESERSAQDSMLDTGSESGSRTADLTRK